MNNKKIVQLIDESPLSRNQIAKAVGVNHSVINRIYSGETKDMKMSTAFKLADVLGVDVNEFRKQDDGTQNIR